MIKDLPDKLKCLRLQYGLSQKQVAEILDISPSIVSAYETGERTPSTDVLLSLSRLFQCSTDFLLGRQMEQPKIVLNTEGLTDSQIKALQALINTIRDGK